MESLLGKLKHLADAGNIELPYISRMYTYAHMFYIRQDLRPYELISL